MVPVRVDLAKAERLVELAGGIHRLMRVEAQVRVTGAACGCDHGLDERSSEPPAAEPLAHVEPFHLAHLAAERAEGDAPGRPAAAAGHKQPAARRGLLSRAVLQLAL